MIPATVRRLVALELQAHQDWARVVRRQRIGSSETFRLAKGTQLGADRLRGVRDPTELALVAPIDKGHLRAVPTAAWTTGEAPAGTRTVWSTGTTGEPLGVPYPPSAAWQQGVLALHINRIRHIIPWATRLSLDALPHQSPAAARSFGRVRAATQVPLTSRDPDAVAAVIEARKPRVLNGAARELIVLGEVLAPDARPRIVTTHGELLTDEIRHALRELYDVEPLDSYGMSEVGRIASQCRAADLYHVHHEHLVVEVLDDDGEPVEPGASGDLVVTTLWNPLVPLVRYRTGDRVTLADRPCLCGHSLPCFSSVDGRTMDWFVDASGRRVPPQRLWLSMHAPARLLDAVDRYRVVQAADRTARVEIVARRGDREVLASTAASYRSVLGAPVEVVHVERLLPGPNGRFRAFTSEATPSGRGEDAAS